MDSISCSWFLDLPSEQNSPGISDLPKDTSCPGILVLPKEIINEIILLVPLIDLFRVSKVCHLFQSLAYQRRTNITNRKEYRDAAENGDILSLMNCSHKYWNDGLAAACYSVHMDIVKLMISRGANDWGWAFTCTCSGGNIDMVELMISKYNLLNRTELFDHWNTGFYYACKRGYMDIIRLLINTSERENRVCAHYWNRGLYGACQRRNTVTEEIDVSNTLDTMQLMIKKGATACYCGKPIKEH